MCIFGETVGHYVGDITREKLAAGKYRFTGPRGSCVMTKARERVYVRSWARSGWRTRTVWNPSECLVDTDAHGQRIGELWAFTLREAADNLVTVLCQYRHKRG